MTGDARAAGIWNGLKAAPVPELRSIFSVDPDRLTKHVLEVAGLRLDFAKTHLLDATIDSFIDLADVVDFNGARAAMFAGEPINNSEGRAVEHCALRGEGRAETVAEAKMLGMRMRTLIDAIEAEALGEVRHILHIGIGGSALGPDLLVDALARHSDRYDVAVVSNVDGAALEEALRGFDPHTTLIAVASKTFTTSETLLNATSALQWMMDAGVDDPYGHVIALTAAPDKAIEWGID
jgi:glucose-6-phosphate isomerase